MTALKQIHSYTTVQKEILSTISLHPIALFLKFSITILSSFHILPTSYLYARREQKLMFNNSLKYYIIECVTLKFDTFYSPEWQHERIYTENIYNSVNKSELKQITTLSHLNQLESHNDIGNRTFDGEASRGLFFGAPCAYHILYCYCVRFVRLMLDASRFLYRIWVRVQASDQHAVVPLIQQRHRAGGGLSISSVERTGRRTSGRVQWSLTDHPVLLRTLSTTNLHAVVDCRKGRHFNTAGFLQLAQQGTLGLVCVFQLAAIFYVVLFVFLFFSRIRFRFHGQTYS